MFVSDGCMYARRERASTDTDMGWDGMRDVGGYFPLLADGYTYMQDARW